MIELGAPWGLLALLGVPLIVLLHSLRPRRVDVRVPATRLWREALRERRRGLGLQRLLTDLRLVLLVLCALAAGLGVADPRWLAPSSGEDETVVVLDASASMQARDGGHTRFERAQARALELVDRLAPGARMLIMTSARRPVLRSGFESDHGVLARAVGELAATDEAGRPRDALALALSLVSDAPRARVYFLTDGAFDDDLGPSSGAGGSRVTFEVLADAHAARNVAITRFDFRAEVGTEERFQMLLGLRNYASRSWTVPVRVTLEGRTLLAREVELPAGGSRTVVLPFTGRAAGRAEASLDVDDDLPADNRAYAVVQTDEPLRVLLFGGENVYLESALRALPNVELTRLEEFRADAFPAQEAAHDVTVFDRIPPPELADLSPRGRYLLIDAVPRGAPFATRGWVERPVISGRGLSPLVADLDLDGIKIERARRVHADPGTAGLQRLFWSAGSDLALAYLAGERRMVYLGFDVAASTFPLQAAFPVFLQQSLDWLRPRRSRFGATQVATGEPVELVLPRASGSLVVETPAGRVESRIERGVVRFEDTSRAGFYRYRSGDAQRFFAVNLTDERESDIAPRAALPAPAGRAGERLSPGSAARVRVALWPYLVELAALFLALELLLEAGRGWRARGA